MVERQNSGRVVIVGDPSLGDADPGKLLIELYLSRYPLSTKPGENMIREGSWKKTK